MLDVGVIRLPPLILDGGMEQEFREFVSILSRCNTHLKGLSITFQVCFSLYFFIVKIYYLIIILNCIDVE